MEFLENACCILLRSSDEQFGNVLNIVEAFYEWKHLLWSIWSPRNSVPRKVTRQNAAKASKHIAQNSSQNEN